MSRYFLPRRNSNTNISFKMKTETDIIRPPIESKTNFAIDPDLEKYHKFNTYDDSHMNNLNEQDQARGRSYEARRSLDTKIYKKSSARSTNRQQPN